MECVHCNCRLFGNVRAIVEGRAAGPARPFCSMSCAQAEHVEGLEKTILKTKIRMIREDNAYFKKAYKAEYLLLKAIHKHSKTAQLMMLKKCMMEAMVDLMEYVISDESDGPISNATYLHLANSTKERMEHLDSYIKLFGLP
jgi:hypothetical protein